MIRISPFWVPLALLSVGCAGEVGSDMGAPPASSEPSPGAGPVQYDSEGNPIPGAVAPGSSSPGPGGAVTPVPGVGAMPGATTDPITGEPTPVSIDEAPALTMKLDGEPLYARAVRLTHDQWENSVRYLLAIDDTGQRGNLAADASGLYDFSNHEQLLFLNANLYRDYQMAAEELMAALGMDSNAIGRIYPGEDASGFIDTVGRRAFRRPLTTAEHDALQGLYDQGAALTENGGTEHARGAALVLQALLQSPYFLYRLEMGEAGSRLSGYELAAKLSLTLLSTTPDDDLLDRAARGELDSDDNVRNIATEMLEDEGAAATMQTFFGELFSFNRFLTITKDVETVPDYKPELNEELQAAAYKFFDRIFRDGLGVKDVLTTTTGFAGPNMAAIYDVTIQGTQIQEVELGAERAGYFTQLPFLILNAVNNSPDSIHRGVTLNNEVLCGQIPPPPNANVALLAAMDGQTNRDRVTATSGPNTCGQSCHAPYINPLGFAFENYDGMGRLRDMDNGHPVDTTAVYPFAEGRLEFDGAEELMQIMAEAQQVHSCYAKHLMTFALQRELTEDDRTEVEALAAQSKGGTSLKELVLSLVTSAAFTTRESGDSQ